ncbi:DNA gyrase subunit A, partial [Clostridium perfringens]
IIVTQDGNAIKFNEKDVRAMGRTASGVRSINLRKDDIAVCMDIAVENEDLLVVSENGFGKRTPITEYKRQKRGGTGLITYKLSEKTGKVIGATVCKLDDELMLINTSGVAIRIFVAGISVTSRSAMGVTLMITTDQEKIVAIAKISGSIEDKDEQLTLDSDSNEDEVQSEIAVVDDSDNSLDKLIDRLEDDN